MTPQTLLLILGAFWLYRRFFSAEEPKPAPPLIVQQATEPRPPTYLEAETGLQAVVDRLQAAGIPESKYSDQRRALSLLLLETSQK